MAKSKYKLDQFIKTRETHDSPSVSGVITAVLQRKNGFTYAVAESDDEIAENEVEAVYRPVKPRKESGQKAAKKNGGKKQAEQKAA